MHGYFPLLIGHLLTTLSELLCDAKAHATGNRSTRTSCCIGRQTTILASETLPVRAARAANIVTILGVTPDTASFRIPRELAPMLGWRRVRVMLSVCVIFSLMILSTWQGTYVLLLGRLIFAGLVVLLAFGLFERRPKRLPRWLARWFLQVLAVAIAVPLGVSWAYWLTTMGDPQPWYEDELRLTGFAMMTGLGVLVAPWIAVAALMRQIKGEAEKQALTFELERSEYERDALDARLRLLQAQVEPHFLFNTLANVRELVESGAPQASQVLANLIAYLRAAVPRLHEVATTVQQELELVRAYLEVMHMRMPDRLQFILHADDAALTLDCPSTTLLTLVENAVRHGIDPSEEGGRIDSTAHRGDAGVSEGRFDSVRLRE